MARRVLFVLALLGAASAQNFFTDSHCGCTPGVAPLAAANANSTTYCNYVNGVTYCDPSLAVESECTVTCDNPRASIQYKKGLLKYSATSIKCQNNEYIDSTGFVSTTAITSINCGVKAACNKCALPASNPATCPADSLCNSTFVTQTPNSQGCSVLSCSEGTFTYTADGAVYATSLICYSDGVWRTGANVSYTPTSYTCYTPKANMNCSAISMYPEGTIPTTISTVVNGTVSVATPLTVMGDSFQADSVSCPTGYSLYGHSASKALNYKMTAGATCKSSAWYNIAYGTLPTDIQVTCYTSEQDSCGTTPLTVFSSTDAALSEINGTLDTSVTGPTFDKGWAFKCPGGRVYYMINSTVNYYTADQEIVCSGGTYYLTTTGQSTTVFNAATTTVGCFQGDFGIPTTVAPTFGPSGDCTFVGDATSTSVDGQTFLSCSSGSDISVTYDGTTVSYANAACLNGTEWVLFNCAGDMALTTDAISTACM